MNHRARAWTLGAVAFALAAAFLVKSSRASDHADSEVLASDPTVDIADVFAFMRPEGTAPNFDVSRHLVATMTVHPKATSATLFETTVEYTFGVMGLDDPVAAIPGALDATIACRFYTSTGQNASGLPMQPFTCSANGSFFSGVTNEVSGAAADPIRVFAGLRSDPAFGDPAAIAVAVRAGQALPSDAGINAFAGTNVLAIVVDVDVETVFFAESAPTALGVSAFTDRIWMEEK